MDTLPVRLRMLRKQCHKTLAEVASEAGISLSFLSDLERGRTMPSLETLEAIAEVFNLTVGEILVNVRIRPEEQAIERPKCIYCDSPAVSWGPGGSRALCEDHDYERIIEREAQSERFYGVDARLETFGSW